MALRIARRGTVGVATHPVPCTSQNVVQNSSASKTKKVTSTSYTKSFVSFVVSSMQSQAQGLVVGMFVHWGPSVTKVPNYALSSTQ